MTKKFPNISWRTKQRRCLLSGKWRRNLQTKIRMFYAQTYYRSMRCRRKLFLIGGLETRAEGPRKFLNLESLKCHFLDFGGSFDRIMMVRKQRFSMSKFTICLQFSITKWAKAYLMNYILEKLQERVWVIWFFAVCHG
jgi:hypothetical protein